MKEGGGAFASAGPATGRTPSEAKPSEVEKE